MRRPASSSSAKAQTHPRVLPAFKSTYFTLINLGDMEWKSQRPIRYWRLARHSPNPQFYISLGAIIILLAVSARMKKAGVRAGSRTGRLGLVMHWASLLIAAILFGSGGFILATATTVNDNTMFIVGLWWAAAIVVWLIGKAVRFILTGPPPPNA